MEYDLGQLYIHFALGMLSGGLLGGFAAMFAVAKTSLTAALKESFDD